jgi:hypothetical protein
MRANAFVRPCLRQLKLFAFLGNDPRIQCLGKCTQFTEYGIIDSFDLNIAARQSKLGSITAWILRPSGIDCFILGKAIGRIFQRDIWVVGN